MNLSLGGDLSSVSLPKLNASLFMGSLKICSLMLRCFSCNRLMISMLLSHCSFPPIVVFALSIKGATLGSGSKLLEDDADECNRLLGRLVRRLLEK